MILLLAGLVAAQDSTDFEEHRVSGESRGLPGPGLPIPDDPHAGDDSAPPKAGQPGYAEKSRAAARWLGVDEVFVTRARAAVELVYARRYGEARTAFLALDQDYPSVALGPVGLVLLYQAAMFENLDYRYDREYRSTYSQAKARLEQGLRQPGLEAPEQFLLAGILGIDGIYALRKGEYLVALDRAWEAIKAIGAARALAPEFVDLAVGDGLYLYWRTVVAQLSPLIPRFEDKRMDGLRKLELVEDEGVILGPAATLALTYSYMEERKLEAALSSCRYGARSYPDNLINLMTQGRVLTAMGRLDEARRAYQRVIAIAPENQRVWYHLGVVESVAGNVVAAEAHWLHYLAFAEVAPWYRAQTLNRLGLLAEGRGDLDAARSRWQQAVALAQNPDAKRSLARTETR